MSPLPLSSPSAAAGNGINGVSAAINSSTGLDTQSFRSGPTSDPCNFSTGLNPLAGGPTSFLPPSPSS
ncbi:hypothetical protein OC835_007736, partial [Tilletia horrida]